ncbi:DUF1048 domain-containing protein [Streptosporangium sandarakinum]|uniref:DNA-binding ferritin-like protein (Dps family) n=1 Tax=Streptosporangium sandarakinum TaxID=1260955 RepID=A0A852V7A1_9ACTN|nr:DUF1048 domain-containing protein [Streptosporangium sandarakinum]NYF43024.1 DNA-binding ferritin-like protein (Dps family) [Streptosporangium sandarakinum]
MAAEPNEPKNRYRRYLEVVTGSLEDKRRYRQYKTRIRQLPPDYRTAAEAMERYLLHLGLTDGADVTMYEDLADLFERSAIDETPIRDLFGEDPVEFVEAFVANYPAGQWRNRERNRLTSAIKRAAGEEPAGEDRTE